MRSRRLRLLVGTMLLVLASVGTGASSAQVAPERPNFVVVMTDDLDERSMQDLDGIRDVMGSNGATFENTYVSFSLCCPSRATFLRGQYPHNHGLIDNAAPNGGEGRFRGLDRDQSTVATWLHAAGYRTSYIGKYFNGYDDLYKPPGWDEWFVLQGDPTNNRVNDNGQSVTIGGHSTDAFADETTDFIRRSSASPEPFFAMIGTKAAHGPPEVAERYQGSFATTPLPEPPNFAEADVSDKPAWVRGYPLLTQTKIEGFQQQYQERLRSMLSVEDLLRDTVATLQETGELENTYILFTSDNGFHMGNHRLPNGKVTPYEEDIGVPLMVRGPGVPAGAVRQQLIVNTDFAPTMAGLAGVSTPAFVDGSSFAPLLTNSPSLPWREALLEEGWPTKSDAQGTSGGLPKIPINKGVHTQDHMFIEYETGEHELYDLTSDPYQLDSKPQTGNEPIYAELNARLGNLSDCSGDGCRAAEWASSPLPETIIDSGPSGTVNIDSATFSFSSSVPGATFECSLDGTAFETCVSPKLYSGLTEGEHAFRVKATDGAGNAEPTAASRGWTVDTTLPPPGCTITGTPSDDVISGTPADDTICAGAGKDTIEGLAGNDTLGGEGGTDTLLGGVGDDTLDGGPGKDTVSYSASFTAISASLATNTAMGEGSDTFSGVENLLGSAKADILTGSGTSNKLVGKGSNDTVRGGAGDDKLVGTSGADSLYGEDGADAVNSMDGV